MLAAYFAAMGSAGWMYQLFRSHNSCGQVPDNAPPVTSVPACSLASEALLLCSPSIAGRCQHRSQCCAPGKQLFSMLLKVILDVHNKNKKRNKKEGRPGPRLSIGISTARRSRFSCIMLLQQWVGRDKFEALICSRRARLLETYGMARWTETRRIATGRVHSPHMKMVAGLLLWSSHVGMKRLLSVVDNFCACFDGDAKESTVTVLDTNLLQGVMDKDDEAC
eukprot:305272-Amphidinium_carterae.1